MPTLSVTPFPYADESLLGYVLRLAKVNGLQSAKELLNLCEIRNIPNFPRPSNRSYGRLINELSEHTGYTVERLCHAFNTKHNNALFSQSRYIKHIDNQAFQCCPKCMIEVPYHREDWNNIFATYCHKHGTPLIDCCSNCNKTFDWQYSQLNGCCHCKFTYKNLSIDKQVSLPVEDFLTKENRLNLEKIDTLCKVVCHVINHQDVMFTPIKELSMTLLLRRKILNYAYALLTNKQFRSNHCKAIERRSTSHQSLSLLEWLTLIGAKFEETVSSPEMPDFEQPVAYVSSHRANLARRQNIPLKLHCSIQEAAYIMQVKDWQFRDLLTKAEYIKRLTVGKRDENIIINRQTLIQTMLRLYQFAATSNELTPDLVSLNWVIENLLPLYFGELSTVLNSIIDLSLPVFRTEEGQTWRDLEVKRVDAIRLVENALLNQSNENIDIEELANVLCLDIYTTQRLIRCTPLTYSKYGRGGQSLHLELVIKFLRGHIVLNRYCHEQELPIKDVLHHIDTLPNEFLQLRQYGCYVFTRTSSIIALFEDIRRQNALKCCKND